MPAKICSKEGDIRVIEVRVVDTVKITAYNHIVGCEDKSRFYSSRINENNTLRGLIFAGTIFREVREFFRKFAKINPRKNFKNLLIREI